jgi:hypothetical protein
MRAVTHRWRIRPLARRRPADGAGGSRGAGLATRLPADRAFDRRAAERFRRRAIRSARWERRPGRPRRPLL